MVTIMPGLSPRKEWKTHESTDTGILSELSIGFNDKTTVQVSRSVRDALRTIARQVGVRSFDEVLKHLVAEYEKQHGSPHLLFMNNQPIPLYPRIMIRPPDSVERYSGASPPQVVKPVERKVEIQGTNVNAAKSSVQIGANSYIEFSYYRLEKGLSDSTMNIRISGVVFNGKRADPRAFMKEQANPLVLYFKVVEKILQLECDPRFELPGGNALGKTFQMEYWNGVFSAYQLPGESLRKDIQEKIERFIRGKAVFQ